VLLYQTPQDTARSRIMVDFLKWALTDGQTFARDLGYAPLPKTVVDRELMTLQSVKVS
jgi:phosphate transport system substrate-binding protein